MLGIQTTAVVPGTHLKRIDHIAIGILRMRTPGNSDNEEDLGSDEEDRHPYQLLLENDAMVKLETDHLGEHHVLIHWQRKVSRPDS